MILLAFLMVFQSFAPPLTYAQGEQVVNIDAALYQLTGDTIVRGNLILNEGTYIYGQMEEDEVVHLQYENTSLDIPESNVEIVKVSPDLTPVYVDFDDLETVETEVFTEEQLFYAVDLDEEPRLTVLEDLEFSVYQDELGLEYIVFGNTVFYLTAEDRQTAVDFLEAENDETITENNEEEIVEEQTEPEDPEQEPTEEEKDPTESGELVVEEVIEEEEHVTEEQVTTVPNDTTQNKVNNWGNSSASYFKVDVDNLTVYSKGNTKELGTLTSGQVYPIDANYGNWHRIQFGNTKGYVFKADTIPDDGTSLKNVNKNYKHSNQHVVALQDVTVFDNSSGSLVEFGKINQGERYPVVSEYGKHWSRVLLGNRIGYILNSEVRHEFTGREKYFTVLSSNLPVYDNRSGSLKQVGSLTKGQAYEIVADYGNWHRIQYNNHYGYVSKAQTEPSNGAYIRNKNTSYKHSNQRFTANENAIVYDNTGGSLKGFGTILEGQSYQISSDYGNWWGVILADRVGYVQKSKVNQGFVGDEKYFRVLTSDLPVYDNRSGSLVQVGSLTRGQEYEIVSDYGNWHRIRFDNYFGYVLKSETEPAKGKYIRNENKSFNHSNKSFIALNNVIVYDNSSGALRPFGRIVNGQSYSIVSDYGNWWKIIFAERVGYVYKNNVQEIDASSHGAFELTEDASLSIVKDNQRVWIATLKKGSIFQKLAEQGNWLTVKYGNQIANVWKPATRNTNYTFVNKQSIGTFLTLIDTPLYDNVNKSRVAAIIEAGETIEKTKKINDNWYEVTVAGRNLFVESAYVIDTAKPSFQESNHKYFDTIKRFMINSPFIYDDPNTPEQHETVVHADLMLQNKIRFPSYNNGIPMDYRNGIDWVRGQGVPSVHQRSFLRQLHGLFFINDLVEAYYITGYEQYIEKGLEYINDWITANPYHKPKHNMAWHDEGSARRLATLVNFFEAGKNILNDQEKLDLFKLMIFHADLLSTDHFYSGGTNHGMFQDEALIAFSKYFYDKEILADYYTLAIDRLGGYFNKLISSEGVHLEHSPTYNQIIARALSKYSDALTAFGDHALGKKFGDQYDKMAHYATHVLKPDGKWPLIADTYAGDLPQANIWTDNPYYQYAQSKGTNGIIPTETNVVYPEAGYAIFRDQWTEPDDGAYIFFTAAYHTSYHKHSDDLSLWIYDGQDIITEAGPHSYTLSDPVTNYAYSSYGHNTLIVDDIGLPRVDGKYDKTYLSESNLSNPLKPSATGVNKRYDGVTHSRNVNYDKTARIIEVNDKMTSDEDHNYKLLWHLAPDIIPEIDKENNVVVLMKQGEELMTIRLDSDATIDITSVYGDEDDIYKSWTFNNRADQVRIDVHTLIVEMDGATGEIQTTFELQNEE